MNTQSAGAPARSEPLRIGLAGAGWVAGHHLDAWSALHGRAVIVAVADPDAAAAASRAAQYGIGATYESVETMLERAALDAIDVAAPRDAHADICRAAARHSVAILCQKPLAPTLHEAEALVTDIDGSVPLMVHENWRFRPHYRQVHEWLRADRIGAVRTVAMQLFTSGLVPDASGRLPALVRQPMLARLERMLLMEVLIHHVDTLRFLLGPLTLQGALLGRSCTAIRGEDRAALLLSTADRATVSLVGDFMARGYPPEQYDRLDIHGTRGSILLRHDRLSLRGDTDVDIPLDLAANYRASYQNAIEHFLDGLQRGGVFETDARDNLETLRIVEAAYALAAGPPPG